MATDGAATSATGTAPVFNSASYNFVSGDVGAKLFIASGSNWIPGWYAIVSVASNKATLNATAGEAVLAPGASGGLSTVNGCATTASPTGATWTIDYSQQAAAQFSYTDLAIQSTNTELQSSGHPFGIQQVGNLVYATSGSGFTVGWYCIQSITGGTTAVMDRAVGTASSGKRNCRSIVQHSSRKDSATPCTARRSSLPNRAGCRLPAREDVSTHFFSNVVAVPNATLSFWVFMGFYGIQPARPSYFVPF